MNISDKPKLIEIIQRLKWVPTQSHGKWVKRSADEIANEIIETFGEKED